MARPSIFILLVSSVAFASAATTVNPITNMTGMTTTMNQITNMTGMTTDVITEVGTTILDNSTTIPSTKARTTLPKPTPCDEATYMVRQSDGDICMLMSFTGTITFVQDGNASITVDIPETTSLDDSTCSDDNALFVLSFLYEGYIWQMQLTFDIDGSRYYMSRVAFLLLTVEGIIVNEQFLGTEFFFVPIGKHYACDTLDVTLLAGTEIKLYDVVLQPFVQLTSDACGLGGAHQCGSDSSPGSNTGLIVGCVIAGVAAVALGGLTFYVIRKRKRNNYSNIR